MSSEKNNIFWYDEIEDMFLGSSHNWTIFGDMYIHFGTFFL